MVARDDVGGGGGLGDCAGCQHRLPVRTASIRYPSMGVATSSDRFYRLSRCRAGRDRGNQYLRGHQSAWLGLPILAGVCGADGAVGVAELFLVVVNLVFAFLDDAGAYGLDDSPVGAKVLSRTPDGRFLGRRAGGTGVALAMSVRDGTRTGLAVGDVAGDAVHLVGAFAKAVERWTGLGGSDCLENISGTTAGLLGCTPTLDAGSSDNRVAGGVDVCPAGSNVWDTGECGFAPAVGENRGNAGKPSGPIRRGRSVQSDDQPIS